MLAIKLDNIDRYGKYVLCLAPILTRHHVILCDGVHHVILCGGVGVVFFDNS